MATIKLWYKGLSVDQAIEDYTVGEDYQVDQALVMWDCIGSIAHAAMLAKIGILTEKEFSALKHELKQIIALHKKGSFTITKEDEDVHTAIENYLTKKLGDVGKKIHTARSRNDQVLLDLRLYAKEQLQNIMALNLTAIKAFSHFAAEHKRVPMPGYTHMQKAMLSSVGLWAGAFAESLVDDYHLLTAAYALNDQLPLGSAAGYGINLPIDREFVAQQLGFAKVQNNVIYVQNSRGKIELCIIQACSQIMNDLNKAAVDLCLFSMPEFGYFTLPDACTTGSSIMPQKKNPDVLELVRGNAHIVQGCLFTLSSLIQNLPSGYNRDFQLTKEPFIKSLVLTEKTLYIMIHVLQKLNVNSRACEKACTPELFATDEAYELVKQGKPFREAYQEVAKKFSQRQSTNQITKKKVMIFSSANLVQKALKQRTHSGSAGNLQLEKLNKSVQEIEQHLDQQKKEFEKAIEQVLR